MSRRYDEAMMGHFEIFGEDHEIIVPSNIAELSKALDVRDELNRYIDGLLHDEDNSYYEDLLNEQNSYIDEYAEQIGDFDNAAFVRNIAYLTDRYGIKVGELEKLLGISTGYISRTAKENSGKRMSVDIAWKIAQFFNVDLKSLLETELDASRGNTALTVQFIKKLISETNLGKISWKKQSEDDSRSPVIFQSKVLMVGGNREDGYNLTYERSNPDDTIKNYIADSVYSTTDVFEGKELSLVSFVKDRKFCYDIILVWGHRSYHFSDIAHSDEDRTGQIFENAFQLIKAICSQKREVKMSEEVRSLITNYLG